MPRRKTPLVAGEYYHIFNRGNNRQAIFFEHENYLFFLRRLQEHLIGREGSKTSELSKTSEISKISEVSDQRCLVIAYCLMPNHYHLLVHTHNDNLSEHLRSFTLSYTKAVNKRYDRTGALFEGAFHAKHVDRDEYLLHLSRYIHLNPVKAGLVIRPQDWPYSSYNDYFAQTTRESPKVSKTQISEISKISEF